MWTPRCGLAVFPSCVWQARCNYLNELFSIILPGTLMKVCTVNEKNSCTWRKQGNLFTRVDKTKIILAALFSNPVIAETALKSVCIHFQRSYIFRAKLTIKCDEWLIYFSKLLYQANKLALFLGLCYNKVLIHFLFFL